MSKDNWKKKVQCDLNELNDNSRNYWEAIGEKEYIIIYNREKAEELNNSGEYKVYLVTAEGDRRKFNRKERRAVMHA